MKDNFWGYSVKGIRREKVGRVVLVEGESIFIVLCMFSCPRPCNRSKLVYFTKSTAPSKSGTIGGTGTLVLV